MPLRLPTGPPFPTLPPPPPSSASCVLRWGTRKVKVNYISSHCMRKCKVLITYCFVTNHHRRTGLTQHTLVTTQCLGVRNLGTAQLGPLLSETPEAAIKGPARAGVSPEGSAGAVSPPMLTHVVVGRTQPCGLAAGRGHPHLLAMWASQPSHLLQAASKGERRSLCERIPE